MNLNDHMNKVIESCKKQDEPVIDLFFKAIIKVGKKETTLNKVVLVKRYLRRYYNIDMNSKTIRERIKNLKSELWS